MRGLDLELCGKFWGRRDWLEDQGVVDAPPFSSRASHVFPLIRERCQRMCGRFEHGWRQRKICHERRIRFSRFARQKDPLPPSRRVNTPARQRASAACSDALGQEEMAQTRQSKPYSNPAAHTHVGGGREPFCRGRHVPLSPPDGKRAGTIAG